MKILWTGCLLQGIVHGSWISLLFYSLLRFECLWSRLCLSNLISLLPLMRGTRQQCPVAMSWLQDCCDCPAEMKLGVFEHAAAVPLLPHLC